MVSANRGFFRFLFVVFIIVLVVIWFLPAPLIKWGIEKYGTQQMGAKVDVADVDFSWLSTRLAIKGLAVTNPQKPMSNLVSFQNIATELNIWELIGGQVYLDEVAIEGIALDAPRQKSGAVPGLTNQGLFADQGSGFSIPGVELPNTQELVDQEKAVYEKRIQELQTDIENKKKEWQALKDSLPKREKLEEYKKRFKALNEKKDPMSRLAALNDLKKMSKEIKQDVKSFDNAKNQINTEYQTLKHDIAALKTLPDQSFAEIVTSLGLEDSKLANLGSNILQGPMRTWIDKGYNYYKLMSGGATAEADDEALQTAPKVIVELTRLSGPFSQGNQKGEIKGTITNLSDAPALARKPIYIDVSAIGGQLGSISLQGEIDHLTPGKEKDQLVFKLADTTLQNVQLSESKSLNLLLKNALVNLSASASVQSLKNLDIDFNSAFKSLDLDAAGEGKAQQAVVAALKMLSKLTIKGTAKGTLTNPELKLKSNLDGVLKTAVGGVIKEKTAAFKQELTSKLNGQLQKQLKPLDKELQKSSGILSQLDQQSAQFQDFRKELKF